MGLSDRDYARDEPPGIFLGGPRSMTTNLILINVGVFLVDLIFFQGTLSEKLSLKPDLFQKPWQFWQLLTYGFCHDPNSRTHLLLNMLALYFFGREVESIYGRKEYLRIYLSIIVLSGLAYVIAVDASVPIDRWSKAPGVLGASGAVVGMVILFVWHYPQKTILFMMVIPAPAWVLGCVIVCLDIYGAVRNQYGGGGTVACSVHLAGAALATIYYKTGWNLGRMLPKRLSWSSLKPRPKLRLHEPEVESPSLDAEVDRILAKISEQGESSLTGTERKTLERASRRYQQRRR